MNHKELWGKIFCDTQKYTDFYFKEKAKKSIVYSKYEDRKLASMAFFMPYQVMFRGKECRCPYIVGVATRPESRNRGYMRMLLEQGFMDSELAGAPIAFLSPADEKIYEPLGFQGVYYRKQIEVQGNKNKWYSAASFSHLDAESKEKAVEFANAQLYMADLDLYIHRSTEYYELVYKEMRALGGKVIVLREGAFIRGVAAYIHEDDFYEVTEVICAPEDGQQVVESICACLSEDDHKKITFSDGYFLSGIRGAGIRIKQMEKPYIMARGLGDTKDLTALKVYINDIT